MQIDQVIELRVHGVSGTPAEDLLDRRAPQRVAGDRIAGFYRPCDGTVQDDSYFGADTTVEIEGPPLEGYVWGGLTSGRPSRAFWLLLLPFTLINVAPRLRPPDATTDAARTRLRLLWFACRLLALSLTITLVLGLCGVGIDLVGWQCSDAARRCSDVSPHWLFGLATARSTGVRMAMGALIPIAGLSLLWLLGRRTASRYEATGNLFKANETSEDPVDAVETALSSRFMWRNEAPVRRLRAIHMQVGFAVTIAFAVAPLHYWQWMGMLLAAGVVLLALVVLWRRDFTGHAASTAYRTVSKVVWVFLIAAGAIAALVLLRHAGYLPENAEHCTTDSPVLKGQRQHPLCSPDGSPQDGLPYFGVTIIWLLAAQAVLAIVLFGVVLCSALAGRKVPRDALGDAGPEPGLGGLGTVVVALFGVFLGSVLTAGVYLYSAAFLETGSLHPDHRTVSTLGDRFQVPEAMYDAGFAYTLAVLIAVVALVVFALRWGLAYLFIGEAREPVVRNGFARDYGSPGNRKRNRAIWRAMFLGRLVDRAGIWLGGLAAIGAVLVVGFSAALLSRVLPWLGTSGLADWLVDRNAHAARHLSKTAPGYFSKLGFQGSGAYLTVLTLFGLVLLGYRGFRAPQKRRVIGILWDLASFWPRVSHPLAPPCYAERTVPDLVERIRTHVGAGKGVVVAAHSQGTVISAAMLLQLRTNDLLRDQNTLRRTSLLTFGCVLRRLYGRYFPVYFGPRTLADMSELLRTDGGAPRWWNLWRYTDYLGGPILCGPPPTVDDPWQPSEPPPITELPRDLHLLDPVYGPLYDPTSELADLAYPKPMRHSDYWRDRDFQLAVSELAEAIPDQAANSTE